MSAGTPDQHRRASDATDEPRYAALRAEADRCGARYVAVVSVIGNAGEPAQTAAHLLGYLHRFADVPIHVYDRETHSEQIFTAAGLLEMAAGEGEHALPDELREDMRDWDAAPQYTGS